MVKKVKAPKTHNPGKGRPKEHLAYLNDREMAFLRMMNGGNMERGPRGLPSFAEDRPAGPGGPSGPNSGPSRGGGSAGAPSGAGGKSSPASSGQRGAGGNYGPGSGKPTTGQAKTQTTSSVPSTPKSPMSGQGPSFSTPSISSAYNADKINQTKTQIKDAISAVKNTPAVRSDALNAPVRTAPSSVPQTSGIYKTAIDVANKFGRPAATAAGMVIGGVNALGNYMKDTYGMMARAGDPYGTPSEQEVGEAFMRAAQIAPGAAATSFAAAKAPQIAGSAMSAKQIAEQAKMAEIMKDIDAMMRAKGSVGTPGELAVDFNKLKNMESLASARARQAQPGSIERVDEAIQSGLDKVTDAFGFRRGPVGRAGASSIMGGYTHGLGYGYDSYLGGDSTDYSEKGDREDYSGKSDFGVYRKGGVVKSAKGKVTAPVTHDPGMGRPKEHLAYLNEREMAALREMNGGNMERGPRGLPSFAEDRPAGPGGSSGGGLGGGGKGSGGPSGGGGKTSGGPGGPSGPNSGPSKSSTTAPQQSSPQATTKTPQTPKSPMSGQGASFSTPSLSKSYNADRTAQQKSQIKGAIDAIKQTPAVRSDLTVGGIRSINVGPMGTPVSVGTKQSYDRVPQSVQPSGVSAPRMDTLKSQYSSYKNPNAPMAQMVGDKLGEYLKAQEQFERDMRALGQGTPAPPKTITPTGNPNIVGGPPRGKTRGIGDSLSAPKAEMSVDDIINALTPKPGSVAVPRAGAVPQPTYPGASFNPESTLQQAAIDRAISESIAARELGVQPSPPSAGIGSILTSPAAAATPGSVDLQGAGYGTFNVPDIGAAKPSVPERVDLNDVYGPSLPEERILEIENLPPERPTYAAGTYTASYDVPARMKNQQAYVDALAKTAAGSKFQGVSGVGDIYSPEDEFSEQTRIPSYTQSIYRGPEPTESYPGADGVTGEDIVKDFEPSVDNPYLSPTTQMPAYPEDTLPMKIAKKAGTIGQMLRLASWADRKMFDRMSPEEQAAAMQRWGERRAVYGRDVGDAQDRSKVPMPPRFGSPAIGGGGGGGKEDSGRPQIYYDWDAGVGIPSPTDSDYTLYLQYLAEKKAAQEQV